MRRVEGWARAGRGQGEGREGANALIRGVAGGILRYAQDDMCSGGVGRGRLAFGHGQGA